MCYMERDCDKDMYSLVHYSVYTSKGVLKLPSHKQGATHKGHGNEMLCFQEQMTQPDLLCREEIIRK